MNEDLIMHVRNFDKNKFNETLSNGNFDTKEILSMIINDPIILSTYLDYCESKGIIINVEGYHFEEVNNFLSLPVICNYIKRNDLYMPVEELCSDEILNYLFVSKLIPIEEFIIRKMKIQLELINGYRLNIPKVLSDFSEFKDLSIADKMFIISYIFNNYDKYKDYFQKIIETFPDLIVFQFFIDFKITMKEIEDYERDNILSEIDMFDQDERKYKEKLISTHHPVKNIQIRNLIKICNFNILLKYPYDFDYDSITEL